MMKDRQKRIAVFLNAGPKVNQDRFAGMLRYAAKYPNWEVRLSTEFDLRKPRWFADAIISTFYTPAINAYRHLCRQRNQKHIPLVLIDASPKDSRRADHVILTNDHAIGDAAASFFLRKGFQHFIYFGTYERSELWHCKIRGNAFSERIKKDGYNCLRIALDTIGDSYPGTDCIINALTHIPKPCAVFAYADYISRFVLDGCHAANLNVPKLVAILGTDNILEITENTNPTLSSILPNFEEQGYFAAQLIDKTTADQKLEALAHPNDIKKIVERSSTDDTHGAHRIVTVAVDYIYTHLSEKIRSAQIAKILGCSTRLLELRFREVCGTTLGEKLLAIRMEKAEHLLKTTQKKLIEIAADCGYATAESLTSAFKRSHGLPPTLWRELANHQ